MSGPAIRAIATCPVARRAVAAVAHSWLSALLAVVILLGCDVSLAQVTGHEGRLLLVAGDVRVQRGKAPAPLEVRRPGNGDSVAAGDTLMTGVDGRVQIRFSDGSLLSIQPRSEFRIDEYRFDVGTQRGFFTLVQGALRAVSGAIGKRAPEDYRMSTPTATIGIRGTEYVAEETVCSPDCSPGRSAGLRVAVSSGKVVVANAAGESEVAAGSAT